LRVRLTHFHGELLDLFLFLCLRTRQKLFVRNDLRRNRGVDSRCSVTIAFTNPHRRSPEVGLNPFAVCGARWADAAGCPKYAVSLRTRFSGSDQEPLPITTFMRRRRAPRSSERFALPARVRSSSFASPNRLSASSK